jgi:hypothetical protein
MGEEIDAVRRVLREVIARLSQSREWLEKNGVHTASCQVAREGGCTCGLEELRKKQPWD